MKDFLTIDGAFGNAGSRSHSYGWKAEELIEESMQVSHFWKSVRSSAEAQKKELVEC